VIILYGGTGDLAKRMVLPAFYELFTRDLLPKSFTLVGNGRGDVAHEDFQTHIHEVLTEFAPEADLSRWDEFAERVRFAGGGFLKSDPGSLLDVIAEAEAELGGKPALLHYLAIPPTAFARTTEAIKKHGLAEGSKAVYEKPYGTSTASFESWTSSCTASSTRAGLPNRPLPGQGGHPEPASGPVREPVVRGRVECRAPRPGADRRAGGTGHRRPGRVLRRDRGRLDMLVTHLFQVAAEVAMEPPLSMSAEDLQAAREAVISAFRPLDPDEVVLGQYRTYRQTEGIADDSKTDTYVAAKLWIDTDRWRGVPFLLRTGKKLAASAQRVSLIFRPAEGPLHSTGAHRNVLVFDLHGNGAIEIDMTVKQPGPEPLPAEGTPG
jgi:glucose-6-phosphate 1-dehydrogenase